MTLPPVSYEPRDTSVAEGNLTSITTEYTARDMSLAEENVIDSGEIREASFVLPDYLWGRACSNPYDTVMDEDEANCREKCASDEMCDFYTHFSLLEGVENVCEFSSQCDHPYIPEHIVDGKSVPLGEHTYVKRRAVKPTAKVIPAPPPKPAGIVASVSKKIGVSRNVLYILFFLIIALATYYFLFRGVNQSGSSLQ